MTDERISTPRTLHARRLLLRVPGKLDTPAARALHLALFRAWLGCHPFARPATI